MRELRVLVTWFGLVIFTALVVRSHQSSYKVASAPGLRASRVSSLHAGARPCLASLCD